MGSETQQDSHLRRLETIAVALFAVNAFAMMLFMNIYDDNGPWGQTIVALETAAAALFLLSLMMSVLQLSQLSKYTLVAGLLSLMLAFISHGVRIIEEMGDRGSYW